MVMELKVWIEKNNTELIRLVKNITNNADDSDELYQSVILQLLEKPERINEIPDSQKKYFFIRVVQNNYNSNTSPYQYQRQKYKKKFTDFKYEMFENVPDDDYQEYPTIEWVYQQLENHHWFDRDLFLLWLELGTFTKVSEQTTIPLNSVGKYIKETIKNLNTSWKNRN
jgi:DNA-directed RNA polymerase specialized sigma24 family protein